MKKTRLFLISLVILIVFSVSVIFFTNYKKEGIQEENLDIVTHEADMVIENIHYTNTKMGVTEWELDASSGEYFGDDKLAIFKDVMVKLYFKDDNTLLLTGDKGEVATDTKNIELWGNVVATSDNGYEFHTQSLKYDSKERKLFTPDKIMFKGHGMELQGTGITVDIDRERFFVLHNVSSVLENVKVD
ncbi:MAG: LPS export ABC transporter periplasmic protein LptC [Thermodesulfobacteriota bacterium]|nr:LPS export ABC transporter periplasmic protein LptC [Thermodesulfobacteriota bacterium]